MKAFTMIEIAATLVILGLLAVLGSVTIKSVIKDTTDAGAGVLLSSARSAVNEAAYRNGGVFPEEDAFSDVVLNGARFVSETTDTSNADEDGTRLISVYRENGENAVLAAGSGNGDCLFVVNSLNERALWGVIEDSGVCNASTVLNNDNWTSVDSTDTKNPTKIS